MEEKKKRRRSLVAALFGGPQRKGVVSKMAITTPRKPNSAKRRYAKVRIIFRKRRKRRVKIIHAHVPGLGLPQIQEYSVVLVEGGSPPDTPGVNYSLIRGVYDFNIYEPYGRKKRRSKFGKALPDVIERTLARDKKLAARHALKVLRKKARKIFKK